MNSPLPAKPCDDPCDVVAVAPDAVRVAPSDEELSNLLHQAAAYRSETQTRTESPGGRAAPPVDTAFRAASVDDVLGSGGRSMARRAARGLIALLLAACIGLAAVAWVVVRSRRVHAQSRPSRSPVWRKGSARLVLAFAIIYCCTLYLLRPVWRFGIDSRMLLPAVVCLALLAAARFAMCLPERSLLSVGTVSVFVAAAATVVSLSFVDHVREDWRVFTGRRLLSRPIVAWIKRAIGTNRDSAPRVLTTGYLIAYLHFVADGYPLLGLPDLGDLARVLPDSATRGTLVVTVPFGKESGFLCAQYQRVYETLLTEVADSVSRGDGYTGWWFSPGRVPQARLAEGARRVRGAELCS